MKKIILSLICFLMFGVVNAAEVKFTYPKTVKKGEEFEIRLVISGANNLRYFKGTSFRGDETLISPVEYDTLNGFVGLGSGGSPYAAVDGGIGLLANNTTGKSGNVEIIYIKYKVKDTVSVGDKINIRMSEAYISSNADGTDLQNISNQDGYCITITVVADSTVTTPKCEYKNGNYYDSNGNVVTKDVYEQSCNLQEETPKCEYKNGKYYDNNGNVVTKTVYEQSCNQQEVVENPKCEYKNGKYYDKNGKVVTKTVYEQSCNLQEETPKCEYKNNKYYDNNGKVVTKDAYEKACGNPETGINSTIVIVIAASLFTIGCYAFFKRNKMYY